VAKIEDNKKSYVKKMGKRIKDWKSEIHKLEKQAKKRGAETNTAIKQEMQSLKRSLEESRGRLEEVKENTGSAWAQKARSASAGYRRMKATADDLRSKIKPK
jgi:hypothetical protein